MEQALYELPEGWAWYDLGDHCQLENGDRGKNYPSRVAFIDSGIPVINAGNLTDDGIDISSLNYISRERYDLLGGGKVRERDLLFCLRGSLGKSAIVSGITEGAIASSLVIVRPNSTLGTEYLQAYFNSHLCASMIKKYDNGAAQPNLSSRSLKKFQIPLPPLNEQKRIVAKLDALFTRIDTAITHLQQTLELSKSLFASALDEAFNGGDNVEKVTIKEIAKKIQYGHTAKARDFGNAQFLRITDIQKGVVDWSQVPYVSITEGDLKKYSLNIHDIVFARSGATSGKSFLITSAPDNAIFASYLIRVVPNTEVIIPQFVCLYFQSPEYWGQVSSNVSGAAQPNINGTKLGGFKIPLPSIDEQKRIVAHLDALSKRTQALEVTTQEKINDLTILKASLLDAAFKGQL